MPHKEIIAAKSNRTGMLRRLESDGDKSLRRGRWARRKDKAGAKKARAAHKDM